MHMNIYVSFQEGYSVCSPVEYLQSDMVHLMMVAILMLHLEVMVGFFILNYNEENIPHL